MQAVSIDVAYAEYRETSSFQRIQEFFTGRESPGNRTLLRSQPEDRSGQYFLILLEQPVEESGVDEVEIEVISTASKESRLHTFSLEGARVRGYWIYCGLTGDDWPDASVHALAWTARLRDNTGQVLAEWESFLQRLPESSANARAK